MAKDVYNDLLDELKDNRTQLNDMLDKVVGFRKNIDKLMPNPTDFSKKFLLEERMKTITSVISTELDIRKQKENSIKTEIELRRKLSGEEQQDSIISRYEEITAIQKLIENEEGVRTPKFEE